MKKITIILLLSILANLAYSQATRPPTIADSVIVKSGLNVEQRIHWSGDEVYKDSLVYLRYQAGILEYKRIDQDSLWTRIYLSESSPIDSVTYEKIGGSGYFKIYYQGLADSVRFDERDMILSNDGSVDHLGNLQEFMSHGNSPFIAIGAEITKNIDGTITISEAEATLKTSNDPDAFLKSYVIPEATLTLTDNAVNSIYIDYNSGSPIFSAKQSTVGYFYNNWDELLFATVARAGTTLQVGNYKEAGTLHDYKRNLKDGNTGIVDFWYGLFPADEGTLHFSSTAGGAFLINDPIFVDEFNTTVAADTFTYCYYNGTSWVRTTGQSTLNNLQWNNTATGLVALDNNKFVCNYVYLIINQPNSWFVVLGQEQFDNITDARDAGIPAMIPPELSAFSPAKLKFKFVSQKSVVPFSLIQDYGVSAPTSVSGSAIDFQNLIDGGKVGNVQTINIENGTGIDINVSDVNGVTATNVIPDNYIAVGDGGVRGLKGKTLNQTIGNNLLTNLRGVAWYNGYLINTPIRLDVGLIKVGIGVDPISELDVFGRTRFRQIANASQGSALWVDENNLPKGYIGIFDALGGVTDDFVVRSQQKLILATGGANISATLDTDSLDITGKATAGVAATLHNDLVRLGELRDSIAILLDSILALRNTTTDIESRFEADSTINSNLNLDDVVQNGNETTDTIIAPQVDVDKLKLNGKVINDISTVNEPYIMLISKSYYDSTMSMYIGDRVLSLPDTTGTFQISLADTSKLKSLTVYGTGTLKIGKTNGSDDVMLTQSVASDTLNIDLSNKLVPPNLYMTITGTVSLKLWYYKIYGINAGIIYNGFIESF